ELVRWWDVATAGLEAEASASPSRVVGLALSPDGATLATACEDGTIFLWDSAGRRVRARLVAAPEPAPGVALFPDGRTLASAAAGAVRLWGVEGGHELESLDGPTGRVSCLAFAPDGRTLAGGGTAADGAGEVLLWRADE